MYKSSKEGKSMIKDCVPVAEFPFDEDNTFLVDDEIINQFKEKSLDRFIRNDRLNLQQFYFEFFKSKSITDFSNMNAMLSEWVEEGVKMNEYQFIEPNDYIRWLKDIDIISNALYACFPEYFFPYFYVFNFNKFQEMCNLYDIALPEIPKKKDKKERLLYYAEICSSLNEFRHINELQPSELCAFFYDFVPKTMDTEAEDETELPNPLKVWYVGGGGSGDFDFLDNATDKDVCHWQCNIDTKPGDIILVYCWSPRSYIHSVWRATTNGFYDPFFFYYKLAYISKPIKVPPITYKEIITNSVLSKNPLANNHFQGVNGHPVSSEEYEEMLRLWKLKGMDISILPRLDKIHILPDNIDLKDERDIELNLVEPFIKKLGFKETDWIRQMPIKMGRGIRYYPDYCFEANNKRGEEKARMILEAKYSIKNSKELQDAYYQAKSYAIRLQADRFILAAKEGIWIYCERNHTFKLESVEHYSWNDIENNDLFHEIKMRIGKNKK